MKGASVAAGIGGRERGGSKLKGLVALLLIAALIFSAVKIIPVYFSNYELEDAMATEARFAGVNRKGEEDVRNDVFRKMQELGIQVKKDAIRVQMSADGNVTISVDYAVPVDLVVYQLVLQFHPHADSRSI